MSRQHLSLTSNSPDETAHLATLIAPDLRGGDVILLEGDVGAGKTHFARCLIQSALGRAEDVPSPTFTLVQTYETSLGDIWHADLYRLGGAQEIEELGLIDAFEKDICLVEWPDRLGALMPRDALSLSFTQQAEEESRLITAHWSNARWTNLLEIWRL